MKAAILEAHRVLTVSPYYAQELISGVDRGVELHKYLRMKTVSGIINGMDVQEWNPSTDKYIDIKYDITTVRFLLKISALGQKKLREMLPILLLVFTGYRC